MRHLPNAKRDELARELGWTLERAQGYVDGESSAQSGYDLPADHRVAMDDYSKGFRTGYYTQACSLSVWDIRRVLAAV